MSGGGEGPDPVDVHVGRRVRLRRKEIGVSQQWLAEKLGLTFQQIQKYERGANRIIASKLHKIARALEAPVAYFFEGLDEPRAPSDPRYGRAYSSVIEDLLAEPNGPQLAEAFLNIRQRSIRSRSPGFLRRSPSTIERKRSMTTSRSDAEPPNDRARAAAADPALLVPVMVAALALGAPEAVTWGLTALSGGRLAG